MEFNFYNNGDEIVEFNDKMELLPSISEKIRKDLNIKSMSLFERINRLPEIKGIKIKNTSSILDKILHNNKRPVI